MLVRSFGGVTIRLWKNLVHESAALLDKVVDLELKAGQTPFFSGLNFIAAYIFEVCSWANWVLFVFVLSKNWTVIFLVLAEWFLNFHLVILSFLFVFRTCRVFRRTEFLFRVLQFQVDGLILVLRRRLLLHIVCSILYKIIRFIKKCV